MLFYNNIAGVKYIIIIQRRKYRFKHKIEKVQVHEYKSKKIETHCVIIGKSMLELMINKKRALHFFVIHFLS